MKKNKLKIDIANQLAFDFDFIEVMTEEEASFVEPITEEEIKTWEFVYGDKDNVHIQFPFLRWHQAEDIARCEKRFFIDKGKGVQVTNGTGVGKTYLGLGLANRFYYKGMKNILIVVPTDKKIKDWIRDNARFFDTEVRQLKDTISVPLNHEGQPGIVITTYSNFYQNEKLTEYDWSLLIYDESHKLQENSKGENTVYQDQHRKLAKLPSTWRKKNVIEPENGFDYISSLSVEVREKMLFDYTQRTKVLFLSASPFAYIFNTEIGDGCLWNIRENYSLESNNDIWNSYSVGYNMPDRYNKFFIENFGYKMRINKLTKPDSGIDLCLMERLFFEKYNKLGVIFGRQIEVDKDYSREFVLLNSEVGQKIDEGLSVFEDFKFKEKYRVLPLIINKKINYLYKNQLLESLKSKLIIPRIQKHLDLNRKVVLFHDYNNSEVGHPFHFLDRDIWLLDDVSVENYGYKYREEVIQFEQEYKHLVEINISDDLSNAPGELLKAFGSKRVAIFNGKIPTKKRGILKDAFQDDLSGIDIICVQRQAGKEGIDLHDTTGVYQRVLIDLGLPRRPTDSIQCEGRTYRDGVMSNAIWEYAIINTIFESNCFSSVISERASTAENLAMGNKARNLKSAFKQGYIDYNNEEPNLSQGIGGKEKDFSYNTMSEFDLTVALYYTNQKKNSKNKSSEGEDYYATPEPLGYKMVQWLDIRPDERVLEPSAGHGAIARFFPGHSTNYAIEPSRELMAKLKLNCDQINEDNYHYHRFEDLDSSNKFNKIAMNPPFGVGGKLAFEHLYKAISDHSYTYGNLNSRIICIVPESKGIEKGLERMFDEEYIKKESTNYERTKRLNVIKTIKLSAEILLPSVTFNRAGTSVLCKILIFDKINQYNENRTKSVYDFRHIDKIEDLFKEIDDLHIPTFIPYVDED
jgi:predicted RNA methylase